MPLQVSVVSAEREVWAGEAKRVVARTTDGEVGIMAKHTPLLAVLAEGRVKVLQESGETIEIEADEGFLSLDADRIEIVARSAQLL